ncbi:MAG: archaea-specific SMC-related protein [Haloarculaceae archaeon]
MSTADTAGEHVSLRVNDVGGIDETAVEFPPGVSVLAGRNATNRTSLLRALMAVLGSDDVSLKGDADEGSVELTVGGETYTRRLIRHEDGVRLEGDPYLSADEVAYADCFAFLLETNDARRAVVSGGRDLREVLLRPVDTDAIERELRERIEERREVETELDRLEGVEGRLDAARERREELAAELEAKRERREELQAEMDDDGRGRADETRTELLEELNEVRNELGETRYRLETARESLEAARAERDRLREELAGTDEPAGDRLEELDRRVEELRARRRELDSLVNRLSTVVRFNEEMLEGDDGLRELLTRDADANPNRGTLADGLLPEETTVCWTCGAEATVEGIRDTLDGLREVASEKRTERRSVTAELEELSEEREEREERRERRGALEARLEDTETDIAAREERVEQLRTAVEEQESRLAELEGELERLEADRDDTLAESQREATDLEFEIGRLSSELEDAESQVEELEGRVERTAGLRERRESLSDGIESLRTRIETVECEAVESFNEHAAALLDTLEYENLERIWLERREPPGGAGADPTDRGEFELHVVRRTAEDVVYEDTVEHLSESEREVTGLVFALAGYLTHEVHERVPFVLLDSLEAIDSDRIARLVDHFADYAPSVVVALLPEDAAALPDDYERIETI